MVVTIIKTTLTRNQTNLYSASSQMPPMHCVH